MAAENSLNCEHENKLLIPSYYSDTEWCPRCGAVRGNNGKHGAAHRWFKWTKPSTELETFDFDLQIEDENV